jgi:hypothetical protein
VAFSAASGTFARSAAPRDTDLDLEFEIGGRFQPSRQRKKLQANDEVRVGGVDFDRSTVLVKSAMVRSVMRFAAKQSVRMSVMMSSASP